VSLQSLGVQKNLESDSTYQVDSADNIYITNAKGKYGIFDCRSIVISSYNMKGIMRKKDEYILKNFVEAGELIGLKKEGFLGIPLAFVGLEGLNFLVRKIKGFDKNFEMAIKAVINFLDNTLTSKGAANWNVYAKSIIKRLTSYMKILSSKISGDNNREKFIKLSSSKIAVNKIENILNDLLDEKTRKMYENEASSGIDYIGEIFTDEYLSNFNYVVSYAKRAKKMIPEYIDNINMLIGELKKQIIYSKDETRQKQEEEQIQQEVDTVMRDIEKKPQPKPKAALTPETPVQEAVK